MLKPVTEFDFSRLAPLADLVAAWDKARRRTAELQRLLEPDTLNGLPEPLLTPARAYLLTLPGYPRDLNRARAQHQLRWDVWRGRAMPVAEADIDDLGLTAEADG